TSTGIATTTRRTTAGSTRATTCRPNAPGAARPERSGSRHGADVGECGMSLSSASDFRFDNQGGASIVLPQRDNRYWLDERARHHRAEWRRRVFRCAVLLVSDLAAGAAGVFTAVATWSLVSDSGSRPVPDPAPLLAMVVCVMPLALRVTGAYNGGRKRTDPVRLSLGVAI